MLQCRALKSQSLGVRVVHLSNFSLSCTKIEALSKFCDTGREKEETFLHK